jgi:hypothetical protein
MNEWEAAWERDRYEVGRAMHLGWKRQKIANGFMDHPFRGVREEASESDRCDQCSAPRRFHHDDMIDWDDLPERQQAINFEGGREGYRLGFAAGRETR